MNAPAADARTSLPAHAALGLASVIFGLFPVFGKKAFEQVSPFAVAALRVTFGATSLALAAGLLGAPSLPREQLRPLAVCALFGIVINQLLFLKGLQLSTATHAGILVGATPAISYGLAVALGRERRRAGALAGVVLAGAGAAWIALSRAPAGAKVPGTMLAGDLLLITNVTSYAIYLVLVREVARRADPIRVIAWLFACGAVAIVPIGLGELVQVPWADLTPRTWGALAFILLGPTSAAYLLNTWAIRRVPSTVAAVYVCVQPVIATLAAWREERPPVLETVGATVLILLGVAFVALAPDSPELASRHERGA